MKTLLATAAIFTVLVFSPNSSAGQILDRAVILNADGSVSGTDMIWRDENLYTLTGNISGSVGNGRCLISVLRSNVVFDGAGYTISGTGGGIAIALEGVSNVTVKNLIVDTFGDGVDVTYSANSINNTLVYSDSSNILILNNTFRTTYWGVMLRDTNNSIVKENAVTSLNSKYGIKVLSSHNNTLINNRIIGGSYSIEDSSQNNFINNTVNGKIFFYLEDASNQIIENAGQVWLVKCNNITVSNVASFDDVRYTIVLESTNNSRILQCSGRMSLVNSHFNEVSASKLSNVGSNVYGVEGVICLSYCNSCRITGNEISANNGFCIFLSYCNNNTIEGNRMSSSSTALKLDASKQNHIRRNIITDSGCGIDLSYVQFPSSSSTPPVSNGNQVYQNNITNCIESISIKGSHENVFFENNITASLKQAVNLFCSDDNSFYHNNLIDNKNAAYETHIFPWAMGDASYYSKNNTWDNGYPSGGNYWSDYKGVDNNGDGIGDSPYGVYENQTDHYPLMRAYNSNLNDQPTITVSPSPSPIPTSTKNPSPTSSPSPSPTTSPSPTPSPTESPSESPTQQPTPTKLIPFVDPPDPTRSYIFYSIIILATLFAVGFLIYFAKPRRMKR